MVGKYLLNIAPLIPSRTDCVRCCRGSWRRPVRRQRRPREMPPWKPKWPRRIYAGVSSSRTGRKLRTRGRTAKGRPGGHRSRPSTRCWTAVSTCCRSGWAITRSGAGSSGATLSAWRISCSRSTTYRRWRARCTSICGCCRCTSSATRRWYRRTSCRTSSSGCSTRGTTTSWPTSCCSSSTSW